MHISFAPLSIHDKSANAGTTLFGGFDVDHSKTPHLNQGVISDRNAEDTVDSCAFFA